jgi:hypothetical protein
MALAEGKKEIFNWLISPILECVKDILDELILNAMREQ